MADKFTELEDRLLRWTDDAERENLGEMLLEIHAFHRTANSGYRAFCDTRPAVRDWRDIPALPQQIFKQCAVRCFPAEETVRTFRTSGTTGEGYGEHHFKSLRLYKAASESGWMRAGLRRTGVLALVPDAVEAPYSSLSQMASWLAPSSAFFVRSSGRAWAELEKRIDQASQPVTLFGTALAFLDWFEWLECRRLRLPEASAAVETGGYKGTRRALSKEALHGMFGERLGLGADAIFNEYGMTELSSQFYTAGVGAPHRRPPWARGVVIDPETGCEVAEGGMGVLRLFDAMNLGSVCAVQTRDLAIRAGEDFILIGRDPKALPRGCSRSADEALATRNEAP